MMGNAVGSFSAVVWPTYVGVLDKWGGEPLWWLPYERAQIMWAQTDRGMRGRAVGIDVPRGTYTHLAFAHARESIVYAAISKLEHPFVFHTHGNTIDLREIKEADFTTRAESPLDTIERLTRGRPSGTAH